MNGPNDVTAGDFVIWVILSIATFGIYAVWWLFSRIGSVYRDHTK